MHITRFGWTLRSNVFPCQNTLVSCTVREIPKQPDLPPNYGKNDGDIFELDYRFDDTAQMPIVHLVHYHGIPRADGIPHRDSKASIVSTWRRGEIPPTVQQFAKMVSNKIQTRLAAETPANSNP